MHKNIDAYSQITAVKVESDAIHKQAAQLQSVVSDQEFQIQKAHHKLDNMA